MTNNPEKRSCKYAEGMDFTFLFVYTTDSAFESACVCIAAISKNF